MSQPPIRHVLVAFDFSDSAERAARTAHALAADVGARVTLGHVFRGLHEIDKGVAARLAESTRKQVDDAAVEMKAKLLSARDRLFGDRGSSIDAHVVHHPEAVPALEDLADRVGADVIACGMTGHTRIERFLLGSVSSRLVRTSRVPVLVVP